MSLKAGVITVCVCGDVEMKRSEDYKQTMAELPTHELYDMLCHEEDYDPSAIEAAKQEFENRNLSPEQISELREERTEEVSKMGTRASMPLSWPLRILMFILSFGILQILLGEYYRNQGYERKYGECWTWMKYGLLFWLCLLLALFILFQVLDKFS